MNRMFLIGVALVGLCHSGMAALFGHEDWRPTPTDPVGFGGQGNNWYPGATPPLEWSDTTNAPAKNIRWKVPIPGWTDAPPIVIPARSGAGRVIGVYSPHHIVCYDAGTGKVLWQDELPLMLLPVLQEDGKSFVPVLDPAKAQKQQWLFERAMALARIQQATWLHYPGRALLKSVDERKALIQYVADTLESWRPELERDFPDLVPALAKDVAMYRLALAGQTEEFEKLTNGLKRGLDNFLTAAKRKLPQVMSIAVSWPGSISDVMATPVSDGEVVCVTMGYGQIAAYDLATGKRLWAWRHPAMNPGGSNHCASPLLWKDLLLIAAPSLVFDRNATGRQWNQQSLLAIDKRTGAIRWERPDNATRGDETAWGKQGGFHGTHESPHLMRYPLGNGQVWALVIGNTGNIVDAETGASLGQLRGHFKPEKPMPDFTVVSSGHGFTATVGDRVYRSSGEDNYNPPVYITQLRLTASNTVEQLPGPGTELMVGQGPFALSDKLVALHKAVDAQTGATRAELGRAASATIAGQYLLLASYPNLTRETNKNPGVNHLTLSCRIFDISQPAKPKLVGTNLITADGYTPDISGKYFPRFAAEPELRKWGALVSGHCNYQGIGFAFAIDTAGLTAHGRRLYLHSPSWLYCIGEAP